MKHPPHIGHRIATALLLVSSGCFWTEDEFISDVMWSDDDEMFAIIVGREDIKTHTLDEATSDQETRNLRKQIYIMPSDFSEEAVPVTAERKTAIVSAFLMSGAGYLLASWGTDHGTEIRQYMLEGEATTVSREQDEPAMEYPSAPCALRGIPSPRGELIAITRECGFVSTGSAFVHVIDAYSHEVLLERTSIPTGHVAIWTPESALAIVGGSPEGTALLWTPLSTQFVQVPNPPCNWPPTTSGPVAEDGTIVSPGTSLRDPIEFADDRPVRPGQPLVPFGC